MTTLAIPFTPPTALPADAAPTDPAALFGIMSTARAMRHLATDPVPDDLLRQLIQAAVWAPTGSNQQGQTFIVITDRAQIARLATLWRQVVADFRAGLRAAHAEHDDPASVRIRAAVDYQQDHFEATPVVIVACYDLGAQKGIQRRPATVLRLLRDVGLRRWVRLARGAGTWAERSEAASILPGVENILLAARALGLGACLTTWHLLAEDELKSILGIPPRVDTYAVIPVGWPTRPFGGVKRNAVDLAIHRDRW